jgi:AraC-like DNA-binding protein
VGTRPILTRMGEITVSSSDTGASRFEFAVTTPALAGASRFCGYVEAGGPVARTELPGTSVTLILSFGDRLAVDGPDGPGWLCSFVAGPGETTAATRHEGHQHGVQVDLDPLAAYRVLGVPVRHLTGRAVAVEDLTERPVAALVERLAGTPTWAGRFDLLDATLARWAADGPEVDPAVAWAWRQVEASGGRVAVADLADETGWSRRHFTARFSEQIGLSPKAAAQVVRFGRAAHLLQAPGGRSIAEVAAVAGYADHSHLVREFRRRAGCTPSDWRDRVA